MNSVRVTPGSVSAHGWAITLLGASGGMLLLAASLAYAFFYGPSYNLSFLFTASAALLALIALAGPTAAAQVAARNPVAANAAVLTLICLAGHHVLASISPETSIAGAWLLATGPLSYLAFACAGERLRGFQVAPELAVALPWGLSWLAAGIAAYRLLADGQRPFDPLSDASAFACLLYLVWVPWMHQVLSDLNRTAVRLLLPLAASLMLLLLLFATGSRAGSALVVLALTYWLGLGLRGQLVLRRVLLLMIVASAAALLAYQGSTALQSSLSEGVVEDASTSERLLLAKAAVDAYVNGSVHGSGALTFGLLYGALRSPEDQTSGGTFVHNDYLQLLAESGPWLTWPLLLLALTSAVQVLFGLLRPASPWRRGRLGGWLALLLACAHALVNFIVYTPALTFVMGGILAWTLMPTTGIAPSLAQSVRTRIGWWLLLLVSLLLLTLFLVEAMAAAVFSGQADLFGSARYRSSPQAQLAFARTTLVLLPERGLPRLVLALTAERAGREAASRGAVDAMVDHFNEALAEYRKLRIVDPWNTSALESYARFLALRQSATVQALLPRPPLPSGLALLQAEESPEALLLDALNRNPRSLSTLAALVVFYDQQDRATDAYLLIKQHFGGWLRYHLDRTPEQARRWIDEFERRAVLADDLTWVERLRARKLRLDTGSEPVLPRIWFKRWRLENQQ